MKNADKILDLLLENQRIEQLDDKFFNSIQSSARAELELLITKTETKKVGFFTGLYAAQKEFYPDISSNARKKIRTFIARESEESMEGVFGLAGGRFATACSALALFVLVLNISSPTKDISPVMLKGLWGVEGSF